MTRFIDAGVEKKKGERGRKTLAACHCGVIPSEIIQCACVFMCEENTCTSSFYAILRYNRNKLTHCSSVISRNSQRMYLLTE